jgi:hypothetical protein
MATGVHDAPRLGLSQWVDSQVNDLGPGTALDSTGPVSYALRDAMQSEDRTSVLIANTFWQSYVNSVAFRRDLVKYGIDSRIVRRQEIMVVSHGINRFSLLLTDPELQRETTRSYEVRANRLDLEEGWDRAFSRKLDALPRARRGELPMLPFLAPYETVLEANRSQPFSVLIAPPFEEQLTHVPSPPASVVAGGTSTAGVLVQDAAGRVGVTAALHAVPNGSSVTVDGSPGTVISTDNITDSCFIEVGGIAKSGKISRGPLKLAPRQHETVTFEGFSTSPGQARIIAWNYELPYVDHNLQQTVRTDLVTAKGDSGAALVDSSDFIVGFAYSRSHPNIPQTYSSWIWADAVFQTHGLTLY